MSEIFPNVSPRVVELVSELTDGELALDEIDDLRRLLAADLSALEWYCDWMSLHSLLYRDLAKDFSLSTPLLARRCLNPQVASETIPSIRRSRWLWMAAATLACVVATLAAVAFRDTSQVAEVVKERPNRQAVNDRTSSAIEAGESGDAARREFQNMDDRAIAVLSRVADASWPSSLRLGQGTRLMAGRFVLESGAVQLEFLSGANLVVEGPADIELLSTMSVFCRQGKLRARVPLQAHGFTIETPTHRAIDLGTEFAVEVGDERSTEVHVLDGEVKLQDKAGVAKDIDRRLVLGDAFRGEGDGNGESIKANAARFIDAERLIQLSEQDGVARYTKWRERSRQVAADPDVVTYFNFEDHVRSHRVLRQDGLLKDESYAGAIVGCRWTEGRWPTKQALEFKGVEDRVRVNIPGEYQSVSLAAWVCVNGFDRFLSSLMLTEGHALGEVHWQFTDTGKLLLGVKADGELSQDFFSDTVLRPVDVGRWLHLACVYDRDVGRVSHYVDGQRVSTEAIRKHVMLRFGASELGNWVPEHEGDEHPIRNLNGRMDEFVLFKKALSDDEIRNMYEAGLPGS